MHLCTKKGWGVLLGVPALFVIAYIYPLVPFLWKNTFCAARNFLGVPCPGCGLTTSFAWLSHWRLRQSIDAHPLGVVIAGWLAYLFLRTLVGLLLKRDLPPLLTQGQRDFLVGVFLSVLILNWVVKLLTL